ncbi:MAG: hypothetical protein Q7S30_01410 [Candidatus Omnitrophota bacterium]|nr:hypothetical protein [Candidatus Omnitrophota bacterium]
MKSILYRLIVSIIILTLITPLDAANAIELLTENPAKKETLAPYSVTQLVNEFEKDLTALSDTLSHKKPELPEALRGRENDFADAWVATYAGYLAKVMITKAVEKKMDMSIVRNTLIKEIKNWKLPEYRRKKLEEAINKELGSQSSPIPLAIRNGPPKPSEWRKSASGTEDDVDAKIEKALNGIESKELVEMAREVIQMAETHDLIVSSVDDGGTQAWEHQRKFVRINFISAHKDGIAHINIRQLENPSKFDAYVFLPYGDLRFEGVKDKPRDEARQFIVQQLAKHTEHMMDPSVVESPSDGTYEVRGYYPSPIPIHHHFFTDDVYQALYPIASILQSHGLWESAIKIAGVVKKENLKASFEYYKGQVEGEPCRVVIKVCSEFNRAVAVCFTLSDNKNEDLHHRYSISYSFRPSELPQLPSVNHPSYTNEIISDAKRDKLWDLICRGKGDDIEEIREVGKSLPTDEHGVSLCDGIIGIWLALKAEGQHTVVTVDMKNNRVIMAPDEYGASREGYVIEWDKERWGSKKLYLSPYKISSYIRSNLAAAVRYDKEHSIIRRLSSAEKKARDYWQTISPKALASAKKPSVGSDQLMNTSSVSEIVESITKEINPLYSEGSIPRDSRSSASGTSVQQQNALVYSLNKLRARTFVGRQDEYAYDFTQAKEAVSKAAAIVNGIKTIVDISEKDRALYAGTADVLEEFSRQLGTIKDKESPAGFKFISGALNAIAYHKFSDSKLFVPTYYGAYKYIMLSLMPVIDVKSLGFPRQAAPGTIFDILTDAGYKHIKDTAGIFAHKTRNIDKRWIEAMAQAPDGLRESMAYVLSDSDMAPSIQGVLVNKEKVTIEYKDLTGDRERERIMELSVNELTGDLKKYVYNRYVWVGWKGEKNRRGYVSAGEVGLGFMEYLRGKLEDEKQGKFSDNGNGRRKSASGATQPILVTPVMDAIERQRLMIEKAKEIGLLEDYDVRASLDYCSNLKLYMEEHYLTEITPEALSAAMKSFPLYGASAYFLDDISFLTKNQILRAPAFGILHTPYINEKIGQLLESAGYVKLEGAKDTYVHKTAVTGLPAGNVLIVDALMSLDKELRPAAAALLTNKSVSERVTGVMKLLTDEWIRIILKRTPHVKDDDSEIRIQLTRYPNTRKPYVMSAYFTTNDQQIRIETEHSDVLPGVAITVANTMLERAGWFSEDDLRRSSASGTAIETIKYIDTNTDVMMAHLRTREQIPLSDFAVIMAKDLPVIMTGDKDKTVSADLGYKYQAAKQHLEKEFTAEGGIREAATQEDLIGQINGLIEKNRGIKVIVLDNGSLSKDIDRARINGVAGVDYCIISSEPEDLAENEIPFVNLRAMALMGVAKLEKSERLFRFAYEAFTGEEPTADIISKLSDPKSWVIQIPRIVKFIIDELRNSDITRKIFEAAA